MVVACVARAAEAQLARPRRPAGSATSSKIGRCTYTRSVHRHTWPVLANTDRVSPATAASRSASAKTIAAFLPPSSNETGRTRGATAA